MNIYRRIYGSPKIRPLTPAGTAILAAWGLTWILAVVVSYRAIL